MSILGESKRDHWRTASIIAFAILTVTAMAAVHFCRAMQQAAYQKRVEEFALVAIDYAKAHGFRLSDFGGVRPGIREVGDYVLLLHNADNELYALRCRVAYSGFGVKLRAVEIGFFHDGEMRGFVDITEPFKLGCAPAPRACLQNQNGFPTKEEFEKELCFLSNPTLEELLARSARRQAARMPDREWETESESPIVRWLGSITGRYRRFEICEMAVGIALLEGGVLVPVLLAFWWFSLRREPPMPWRRVLFHIGWGGVLIGVGALLCERTYDALSYRFGSSSDQLMVWTCRTLLMVGFALYLWHVIEGGREYSRIPGDARLPEGGWRWARAAAWAVVILCLGYVALAVGMSMHSIDGPDPDAMVLWIWGGALLAAVGGIGLLGSIGLGLKALRRPIGEQEPAWARFVVVIAPLFVLTPGIIAMLIAADVH